MKKDNLIQEKSFNFALKIIGLHQELVKHQNTSYPSNCENFTN